MQSQIANTANYVNRDSLTPIVKIQGDTLLWLEDYAEKLIEHKSVSNLSKNLMLYCRTDQQRVWVIFRWITSHIRFDLSGDHDEAEVVPDTNKKTKRKKRSENQIDRELSPQAQAILEECNKYGENVMKTLKINSGVCRHYARLFEILCVINGIQCRTAHGFADENIAKVQRKAKRERFFTFKKGHAWNVVSLDGQWYICDPTWASGIVGKKKALSKIKFSRKYNPDYYLIPYEHGLPTHIERIRKYKFLWLSYYIKP